MLDAPQLRTYQEQVVSSTIELILQGSRKILLVAPTGAGKTIMAGALVKWAVDRGLRVLFLCHLDVLPEQTARAFESFGLNYGFIKHGLEEDRSAKVQIASIQTLPRRQWWKYHDFDLVIHDECHKVSFSQTARSLLDEHCQHSIHIGLTGTPWRLSKREGMGDIFDSLVLAPTPGELMEMGFLTRGKYYSLPAADLGEVRTVGGDYNEGDLSIVCNRSDLVEKIVDEYLRLAQGKTAIAFGVDVAHAVSIANAFNRRGIAADFVTGSTAKKDRDVLYQRLAIGDLKALSSVGCLSEGFDVPSVGAVILARPTKSKALFFQQLGRGLRPSPGKDHCTVLDQSGNVRSFGFAEDLTAEDYSLTNGKQARSGEAPLKECPECALLMHTFAKICSGCNYEFPGTAKVSQVGSLEYLLSSPLKEPKKPKKVDPIAPLKEKIDHLRQTQLERQYKPGWLAFKVLDMKPTLEDLEYTGKILGYHHSWAKYKHQGLLQPRVFSQLRA